jgi:hypothetical protein
MGAVVSVSWASIYARCHVPRICAGADRTHCFGPTQRCLATRNTTELAVNSLTLNDLERRRALSPLKIKIPSKNMSETPTNTPIIHAVD